MRKELYSVLIPMVLMTGISLVSACSSSSDNTGSNTRITSLSTSVGSLEGASQIGWFSITNDSEFDSVFASSIFFEAPANLQDNVAAMALTMQADTCVVEADLQLEAPLFEDRLLNDYVSVSAGEVLTLTSPNGTYGELTRLDVQNGLMYLSLSDLAYPGPDSLTITIPGDQFVAASLTIDKPASVEEFTISNINAEDGTIKTGTTFSWNATTNLDTLLSVTLLDADSDFNPDNSFTASCLMVDDGEFTLPESVFIDANAILGSEARIRVAGVSRSRATAFRSGADVWVAIYNDSN
ncbi:MAG: hypothetical protein AB8B64_17745 [Granulosicoccus sp.]